MQTARYSFLFVILSCLFAQELAACLCNDVEDDFCYSAYENDYIVAVEVLNFVGTDFHFMEVKLLENLNQLIDWEYFLVEGQDGINCGAFLSNFSVGDSLVMNLDKISETEYHLSGCGRHYLRYSASELDGLLYANAEATTYAAFKGDLSNCIDYTTTGISDRDQDEILFNIYPNPATDYLNIQLEDNKIEEMELFSSNGKSLIRETQISDTEFKLDLSSYLKGIYFLRIKAGDEVITRKVVLTK